MLGDRRPQGDVAEVAVSAAVSLAASEVLGAAVGVGVDVVDLVEFGHNLRAASASWPKRVFTPGELEHCDNRPDRLGARFAAKEAVAKALGFGFRDLGPRDVEIVTSPEGKPIVVLHGTAQRAAGDLGIVRVLVSMTREGDCAAAVAVAVQEGDMK